jgi:glycosyltransferase involved in cell wall biosynthesis
MMLRAHKLVLEQIPDTYLVIAGQGEEEQKLKELAVELGTADKVTFIGLRFDLPEIYQLFDVFLLTSFSEGISVTLLEAMASGVSAVVTDVGGNREVVVEGVTGYMVPVDDDRLFAERASCLLMEPEKNMNMAEAARKLVNQEFSVQGMMQAYQELYDKSSLQCVSE